MVLEKHIRLYLKPPVLYLIGLYLFGSIVGFLCYGTEVLLEGYSLNRACLIVMS